jgi:hypothetical protein
MGKHFNSEVYRRLECQAKREMDEDLSEAERAAGWDDFEPRHVTLGDELYAPGIQHVLLGDRR